MDKRLNVWQYLVVLSRLVVATIIFFVQHRLLRFWPPRERPLVTVRQGKVRGISSTLPNGKPYHYFKGIPYAKAPVGELRFRAPVPLDRFRVPIVDCCVERADYVQLDFFSGFVFGSESALYLNVYTPVQQLPVRPNGSGLPVMVFLHGGGFACGTGSSFFYAPDSFLQKDVIVVTVYYRLGPLGFLYLPEAGIEGNAGLKDQLMALRWVNENIAQFGGDPQCVTLFGESAGSFSSYLHMLSPNSRKYFHRVICQSGVVCSSSFMQTDGVKMAFNLARYFGYKGSSQKGALDTLLNIPAVQLAKHQRKVLDTAAKHNDLVFVFLPVVEQTLTNDSIITQQPEQILKTYDTLQIPLLEGCNDGEGILGLFIIRNQLDGIAQLPNRLASKMFRALPKDEISRISERIKRFYFGDQPADRWDREQLKHLLSDMIFMTDSWLNAEWVARYQPHLRHYHYRFTYDGRFSILKRFYRNASTPGACHGDELMYMFCPRALPKLPPSSEEHRVRENIIALWTSFAKHGDPSVESRDIVDVRWEPVPKIDREATEFRLNCLEINVHPTMVSDPCVERMNFWRSLCETSSK
ncbi:carboxylesterase [Anopheles darlingi]|uniref:Carboxylic ester hydrolase n=1 Tax=Anopheles darlingi TaxID=43151 RepID=W5JB58_ANODA|nr:carboxylesterase [Anopheles darlingi]